MLTTADVARLLLYGGVLSAMGGCGAEWFMGHGTPSLPLRDASTDAASGARRRRALLPSLAVLVALLMMLAGQFVALELSPTRADLAMLLRETGWGRGWSAMALSALCGAVASAVGAALPIRALLLFTLAVSMSGVGHAAADPMPLLARTLDTLHIVCVGLWIGTLLCLGRDTPPRAWARFSRAAFVAAPLSVLTGVGSAFRRVGGVDVQTIIGSEYGVLLAAKAALVVFVLAIGARHRSQVAARGEPTAISIRIELLLAMVILTVTAVLTGTAPPGE